jgi:hypothetical protein
VKTYKRSLPTLLKTECRMLIPVEKKSPTALPLGTFKGL